MYNHSFILYVYILLKIVRQYWFYLSVYVCVFFIYSSSTNMYVPKLINYFLFYRLVDLASISIEKKIAKNINLDDFVEKFGRNHKNRKIILY